MVASAEGGSGAWFSSFRFWIGAATLACFLGLSGVTGRALSMGLRAMAIAKVRRRFAERDEEVGIEIEEEREMNFKESGNFRRSWFVAFF